MGVFGTGFVRGLSTVRCPSEFGRYQLQHPEYPFPPPGLPWSLQRPVAFGSKWDPHTHVLFWELHSGLATRPDALNKGAYIICSARSQSDEM